MLIHPCCSKVHAYVFISISSYHNGRKDARISTCCTPRESRRPSSWANRWLRRWRKMAVFIWPDSRTATSLCAESKTRDNRRQVFPDGLWTTVKSATLPSFWTEYRKLSEPIRKAARKSYQLWKENPFHPSLRFKCLDSGTSLWSVRITRSYRALGIMEDDTVTWYWIGSHRDYERLYK